MASDIYFDKVGLLLHFDGADGSTTFTDVTGKAVTRINTLAKISTDAHKFGGASLKVTQVGYTGANGVRVSHHSSIALSDKDFTIEFWMNPISISNQSQFLRKGGSSTHFRYLALLCNTDGSLRLVVTYNASSWAIDVTSTTGIVSINNWYHVAIVRNGSSWRVYLNGSFVIDTTSSGTVYDGTEELSIGCGIDNYSFVGYMDDFRITVGVARYTANFTPPTSAFPSGFGIISGILREASPLTKWRVRAYREKSKSLDSQTITETNTFSLSNLTPGESYFIVADPYPGKVWTPGTLKESGEYIIPTNPSENPHIYGFSGSDYKNDPFANDVVLRLRMNGSNGSTSIVDDSPIGATVTAYGGCKISTDNSITGGSSCYFPGTNGSYLRVSDNPNHIFAGDFTFELWQYGSISNIALWCRGLGDSNTYLHSQSLFLNTYMFTSTIDTVGGVWRHFAIVRHNGTVTLYQNGVSKGSAVKSGTIYLNALDFGFLTYNNNSYYTGYIDDVRMTKAARYTADFVGPTGGVDTKITGLTEPSWTPQIDTITSDEEVSWKNLGKNLNPVVHGPITSP